MSCPYHTQKRHPRICRFCRADTGPDAPPFAGSDGGPVTPISEEELAAIEAKVEQDKRRRRSLTPALRAPITRPRFAPIRCRPSMHGYRMLPGIRGLEGTVVGESKSGMCWRVQFDGRRSTLTLHKDFIELIGDGGTSTLFDRSSRCPEHGANVNPI